MKRLDKHQSKEFGPVKVQPSDIRELLSVLDGRKGLQFVADDIEFDSPNELFSEYAGRTPASVSLKISDPHLRIELSRLSARLYVSSSDTEASGLFSRLDTILQRCERRPRLLYSSWRVILIYWLLLLLSYLPSLEQYQAIIFTSQVALTFWLIWVLFIQLRRHALVLTDAARSKSFWKRNSDSVLVAIVSALIGAAGGAFATKLADHYFPATAAEPDSLPASRANSE